MSMENSSGFIGNRTRDFPACSAVDVGGRPGISNTTCTVSIVKVMLALFLSLAVSDIHGFVDEYPLFGTASI